MVLVHDDKSCFWKKINNWRFDNNFHSKSKNGQKLNKNQLIPCITENASQSKKDIMPGEKKKTCQERKRMTFNEKINYHNALLINFKLPHE